ncbi:hypothetical protein CL634_03410 [bacterium]|nr:hypothetical protein [bacterium]|tara:strand:- start:832 stop:1059 length:228 start_codon:yes stop_codon:yes gene_type:complete
MHRKTQAQPDHDDECKQEIHPLMYWLIIILLVGITLTGVVALTAVVINDINRKTPEQKQMKEVEPKKPWRSRALV